VCRVTILAGAGSRKIERGGSEVIEREKEVEEFNNLP
jgi:hypothetical protein